MRPLQDGDARVIVISKVAYDLSVAATAVVGIAELVQRVRARRAVGVGGAVDVDVHAAGEEGEVLRGRRELGLGVWRGGVLGVEGEEGEGEREGEERG